MRTHEPESLVLILTVGHSNRSIEDFLSLLRAHDVRTLADVRSIPRSRHNPQFNRETLSASLGNIAYVHLPALGGLRHARANSPNSGWKNASFRGYADYMQTDAFQLALAELIALAAKSRLALMCAESLPWRCHRSLIADALVARGVAVEHIFTPTTRKSHALTSFAVVRDGLVMYPAQISAKHQALSAER